MAVVRTLIGNVRGPQGEDGRSFAFAKTYATIAAMNSDFSGTDTQTGDYVLISAASINDADNGKMYRKGNSAWIYVAKITGPAGATGPAGPLCQLDTSMAVTVAGQAALDAALGPTLADKLDATGDSANNTVTYTSDDVADGSASAWETVQPLTSEEKHESLFAKISKVVKNVRFLYKLLGTTDISGIGSGTVTDIMSALHSGKFDKANVVNNLTTTTAGYALDAREGKTLADNVSALNNAKVNLSDLRKITYIASKDLGWDTGRGTAAFNNNGSLSLPSAGIYLFVTETWTKSDFNTRTWAAMDNTVANIGMTTKSPPKIVGEGYLQIIQLCVASAAMTVNCQYWDAAGTGAAHRWTAYKLFA